VVLPLRTGQGIGAHSVACAPGHACRYLSIEAPTPRCMPTCVCVQRRAYRTTRCFHLYNRYKPPSRWQSRRPARVCTHWRGSLADAEAREHLVQHLLAGLVAGHLRAASAVDAPDRALFAEIDTHSCAGMRVESASCKPARRPPSHKPVPSTAARTRHSCSAQHVGVNLLNRASNVRPASRP